MKNRFFSAPAFISVVALFCTPLAYSFDGPTHSEKKSEEDDSTRRSYESPPDGLAMKIPKYNYSNKKLRFGYGYYQFGPTNWQTVMESTPATFYSPGYEGELELGISDKFAVFVNYKSYSFSRTLVTALSSATSYSASGHIIQAGLLWYLMNEESYNLSFGLGGGFSVNTMGNTTTLSQVKSNLIYGFPFSAQVVGDYRLATHLGLFAKLGYLFHTVPFVPYLAASTGAQSNADVSLNALFATVGLEIFFTSDR